MDERLLALNDLLAVFSKGARSNALIDERIKAVNDPGFFPDFYTRLFLGTLERILFLDAIIDLIASVKTKKQHPVILNILRLSVYQILYMDSVPEHAVVDSAVRLCVKKKQGKLKGFVNAVLRSFLRERDSVLEAAGKSALSVRLSIKEELFSYLQKDLKEVELMEMLSPGSGGEGICVRVNEARICLEDAIESLKENKLNVDIINELPANLSMLRISGFKSISQIPGFSEGHFYIQDPNSVLGTAAAGIKSGDRVLDVCASPGGKGFFAAQLAGDNGLVIMRDLSEKKCERMRENAARLGIGSVRIEAWDALVFDETLRESADVVIADLPCSGLGTIHKKPEIKYRMTMDAVRELAKLQLSILNTVCGYVKPGGRLVFSTCTVGSLENENNTEQFLEINSGFNLVESRSLLPGEGDGFYYAIMERFR